MRTSQTMTSGTNVPSNGERPGRSARAEVDATTAPAGSGSGRTASTALRPGTSKVRPRSAAIASARRPSTLAPVHRAPGRGRRPRELGPAAAASTAAASSSVGVDDRVEEAGVRRAVRVVHLARRPSRAGGGAATAAPARARPPSAAAPCRSAVSISPMRNVAARADALVGAEQQQRARRDRVAGARDRPPAPRSRTCGVKSAPPSVTSLPGRGRARAHHLEVEAAARACPGAPVISSAPTSLLARVLGPRRARRRARAITSGESAFALPFAIVTCAMRSRTS